MDPNQRGIVFCNSTPDGCLSAAILQKAYPRLYCRTATCHSDVPWERIHSGEHIFILDFSFPIDDMRKLYQTHSVTFLNHDQSTADELLEAGIPLKGSWGGEGSSAMVTWKHLFPYQEPPFAVKLVSDYYTWKFKYKETIPLSFGMGLERIWPVYGRPADLWVRLLADDKEYLQHLIEKGIALKEFYKLRHAALNEDLAYDTLFLDHKALAMNMRGITSLTFEDIDTGDKELTVCYQWNNSRSKWTVSLYQTKDSVLDVSILAGKFGGGGQPGAAGFDCDQLPFNQCGIKSKKPVRIDPYAKLQTYIFEHPLAQKANDQFFHRGFSFTTMFEGYKCIGANTPDTTSACCAKLDYMGAQLAITFVWTNSGKYRFILSTLDDNVNLERIRKKYKGTMVGSQCWFYSPTIPFNLDKYISQYEKRRQAMQ